MIRNTLRSYSSSREERINIFAQYCTYCGFSVIQVMVEAWRKKYCTCSITNGSLSSIAHAYTDSCFKFFFKIFFHIGLFLNIFFHGKCSAPVHQLVAVVLCTAEWRLKEKTINNKTIKNFCCVLIRGKRAVNQNGNVAFQKIRTTSL